MSSFSDQFARENGRADAIKILALQYSGQWNDSERFEQRRERQMRSRLSPRQFREYEAARARAMRDSEVHGMAAARAGCSPRRDWINDVA